MTLSRASCLMLAHKRSRDVPCQIDGLLRAERVTCSTREGWESVRA